MNISNILSRYSPIYEYNYKQLEYLAEKLDEKYSLELIAEIFRCKGYYIGSKIGSKSKYDSCYQLAFENLEKQLDEWKNETIKFLKQAKNPSRIRNRKEATIYYRLFESFAFFNFKNFVRDISNIEMEINSLVREFEHRKRQDVFVYFKILQKPFKSNQITDEAFFQLLDDFLEQTLLKEVLTYFEKYFKTALLERFAYSTKKFRLKNRTVNLLNDFRIKHINLNSEHRKTKRHSIIDDLYLELILNKNCNNYIIRNADVINNEIKIFQQRCDNQQVHNNTVKQEIDFLVFLNKIGFQLPNNLAEAYIMSLIKNFEFKVDEFIQNPYTSEYEKGYFILENLNTILTAFNYNLKILLSAISHLKSNQIFNCTKQLIHSLERFKEIESLICNDSHLNKFVNLETFNVSTNQRIDSNSQGQLFKIKLPPYNEGFFQTKDSIDTDEFGVERNIIFALDYKIILRHFTTTKSVLLSKISQSDIYLLNHYKINPLLFNLFYFLFSQIYQKFNISRFFPFNNYTPYSRSLLNKYIIPRKYTANYILDFENDKLKQITQKICPTLYSEMICYFENQHDIIFEQLRQLHLENKKAPCRILCKIKGGFTVTYKGLFGFLPGSQCNIHAMSKFLGNEIDLDVLDTNSELFSFTASNKKRDLEEAISLSDIKKNQVLKGVVKNFVSYGVFIDLGGFDGLIHITDLSWGRVTHPKELLKLDQKINVVILDFDEDKERIALGLKQLQPHPWDSLNPNLQVGDKVTGKVVSMVDYGAFIEIAPGVEGLIHVSEMSWSQHTRSAHDFLKIGDRVEAVVLTLDREERKMSLGIKQLLPDLWNDVEIKYAIGTRHKAKVLNLTNFGVFIELKEGVDGLIHISDLSWQQNIKHPSEFCKVGDTMEVIVLEIDRDHRRISLGHKQLEEKIKLENHPISMAEFAKELGVALGNIINYLSESNFDAQLTPNTILTREQVSKIINHFSKQDNKHLILNNKKLELLKSKWPSKYK